MIVLAKFSSVVNVKELVDCQLLLSWDGCHMAFSGHMCTIILMASD